MVFNDASFQNILFLNKPYFTLWLISRFQVYRSYNNT